MTKELRSKPFQLRMRPSVKEAAERAAHDGNQSLSSLIELVLIKHLRSEGYLPADTKGSAKKK